MEPESYKYLLKYIIIGDSGVGKSCLLRQFTESSFNNNHNMTIGVEFGAKITTVDDTKVKLQIWDTAGQDSFRSITRSYYRGAIGALVVYDVTSRQSFDNARTWYSDCREMTKTDVSILLIGNKADLAAHREVSEEEARDFAKENDMEYVETSAKTAQNVDVAFFSVAKKILHKIQEGKIDPSTLGGAGGRDRSNSSAKNSHNNANGNNGGSGGGGGGPVRTSTTGASSSNTNNDGKVNIGSNNGGKKEDDKEKKCCK